MEKYQDRGMKKWQGFILSEHNEVLKETLDTYTRQYIPPVQMEMNEIIVTLRTAYLEGYRVWIALNQVDLNGVYFEIEGKLQGYDGSLIRLNNQSIPVEEIRTVEFVSSLKFWQIEPSK